MVPLLPVDCEVGAAILVRLQEILGLDHEGAGPVAGLIQAATRGLDHLDDELDDRLRRMEVAAALTLVAGELGDEILVDAADQVEVPGRAVELDVREEVDQAGDDGRVEYLATEDLRERALELLVVGLDRAHGVVDLDPDALVLGVCGQCAPACGFGYPEDAFCKVFIGVLGHLLSFGQELVVLSLEGSADVAQEQQAQGHVLVFARVHGSAHLVGAAKSVFSMLICPPFLALVPPACCFSGLYRKDRVADQLPAFIQKEVSGLRIAYLRDAIFPLRRERPHFLRAGLQGAVSVGVGSAPTNDLPRPMRGHRDDGYDNDPER